MRRKAISDSHLECFEEFEEKQLAVSSKELAGRGIQGPERTWQFSRRTSSRPSERRVGGGANR